MCEMGALQNFPLEIIQILAEKLSGNICICLILNVYRLYIYYYLIAYYF